ncbi:MAG TPA: tetraacyldisaccharide 4'-kinase [Pyrinomonadaceae bacterium]|nr:tetraacyldisaccharide 4'-kinase [Pyrinomonadaceae bacterium]
MTFALAPFSLLYGATVRARAALYRSGALAVERVGAPVVSVGNITTGGTGKTPLVEWAARALARGSGKRVCVLTRGYGREDERRRVVVSDGEKVLAGAREGGDEPRLLAESLLGVAAVLSDADRVAGACWAAENLGAEVFVLDDGFQHLRLARELDIVTVDATNPWGGGHLLPRGRLREPRRALARAGCVVITRADLADDLEALRAEVLRLSEGRAVVLASWARTLRLRPLGGESQAREDEGAAGGSQRVGAFCGVGNPEAFFAHVRRDGREVCYARAFPDHHVFTTEELEAVARESAKRGASAVLLTAKDAVKIEPREFALPFYVLEIGLEFDDESALLKLLDEAVAQRG